MGWMCGLLDIKSVVSHVFRYVLNWLNRSSHVSLYIALSEAYFGSGISLETFSNIRQRHKSTPLYSLLLQDV